MGTDDKHKFQAAAEMMTNSEQQLSPVAVHYRTSRSTNMKLVLTNFLTHRLAIIDLPER